MASAPRSAAESDARAPPSLPIGVRADETSTDSAIGTITPSFDFPFSLVGRSGPVVRVEAPSRLSTEQARLAHPDEEGWGGEERLLELLVQRVGDGGNRVQADEVAQGERAHGVVAPVDHALVDVLRGGEV